MPSPHQYGPHQPESAPNAVTVLSGGTSTATPIREEVLPLPAQLVAQRARANELARQYGAGEGTVHECSAAGREVWLPALENFPGPPRSWCPLCFTGVVTA